MNTYNAFAVRGVKKLKGKIKIQSSKNAFLPILAGCLLCDEKVILNNCPQISDIDNMLKILVYCGVKVDRHQSTLHIDANEANNFEIPEVLSKVMRSSIFLMGAMMTRFKKVKLSYPGGCAIGARPIDLHLKAFRELNITVEENYDKICCSSENITPKTIVFEKISVGATENVILATVKTKGVTIIENCAREPEIVDLANFLNSMGAKICGAGTGVITIEGVEKLHSTIYTPISDRIVAGTYLIATAMTGGEVEICNTNPKQNFKLIEILSHMGCKIETFEDSIKISSKGRLKAYKKIVTMPYPEFPTDLQSQMLSLQSICEGECRIVENIFENRFKNAHELKKMGADIEIIGNEFIIVGKKKLSAAKVECFDLRGGAGLVLAGLVAKGKTIVLGTQFVDRGYVSLDSDLNKLGAKIKRINVKLKPID